MVPPPAIDLIALDLDGTLLGPRDAVSAANRRALRAANAAGVRTVVVTGRAAADVPAGLIRELNLDLPFICAHGAVTKDFRSGRTLGHIPLPAAHALPMLEHAEKHRLHVAAYCNDRFWHLEGMPRHLEHANGPHWRAVPSLVRALQRRRPTFIRIFGRPAIDEMHGAFAGLPLHFKHEVWEAHVECAVTSPKATKEAALANLCANLNVTPERVLAIGDSRNDVPMLRWAGTGIAMGNALPEVRRAVALVTRRCDEDGVAHAIERYVLEPRRRAAVA